MKKIIWDSVRWTLIYLAVIGFVVTLVNRHPDDKPFSDLYLLLFSGAAILFHALINGLRGLLNWRKDNYSAKAYLVSVFFIVGVGVPAALGIGLISDAFLFQMPIQNLLK